MQSFNPLATVAVTLILITSCNSGSFSGGSSGSQKPAAANVKPQATPLPTQLPIQTPPLMIPSPMPPPQVLPPNAVVKGSFSAWASPANPAPGQTYDIIINVKLPSNVMAYTESDLTGFLTGTDGYKQTIGPNTGKLYSMQAFSYTPGSGVAQLIVHVPGAQSMVQDTVDIRSSVLNEAQTITIRFQ